MGVIENTVREPRVPRIQPADAAGMPPTYLANSQPKPPRNRKRTKPQLPSREELDGRLNALKAFERRVSAIKSDLGGADQLSTMEIDLVEAFANSAVVLDGLNVRLLLGAPVDRTELAATISSMVRVASRLGLRRRSRDVTPSLKEYLKATDSTDDEE